ncbi:MAG: diacylglycerol kinase family lipid kinase [Actinomycetota bacterium]|nr:diacylglycerol kinase family lipid kinase [Actinomycetota bacterium]
MAEKKSKGKNKKSQEKTSVSKERVENPNSKRTMMIINPVAGTGKAFKIWKELKCTLQDLALDFDYRFTEDVEHAIEIASEVSRSGYGLIGVVGGDGTLFEVVNGVLASANGNRPAIGLIPTGRGSDFSRSVGIPHDWLMAASLLVSGRRKAVDAGKMSYRGMDGSPKSSFFINIAGVGFDGEVTERANNFPEIVKKAVGGIGTYFLSLIETFARFKDKDVQLHVDDKVLRVLAASVVVANGQYFGGNMHIAPDASTDDGLFDIVVIGAGFGNPIIDLPSDERAPEYSGLERAVARMKMAKNLPTIYTGTHIKDPSLMVMRGKKVEIKSNERLVLQADGEVIGEGPLTVEIIPQAVEIVA